ncbi:MAG TPA: malto-oligosyltrehalose trehalohydrolase [Candidatus Methylacidiphilales bacterium]|nr:malto-oligosyltrehalose trehalohydrolase [Candidatus Methylacidiphilales bacterium]
MPSAKLSKFLQPEEMVLTDIGPCLHPEGVTYRVWALGHTTVAASIEKQDGTRYTIDLEPAKDSGYFYRLDPRGEAGDLYRFSIDGGPPIPDLASHFQPRGIHGPSLVVDGKTYLWKTKNWKRPPWNGHVIYECHIGTFTPEGTFRSAIEKLSHLSSLGVTAIELMPLAEWAGERNWGYDGVMLFAPSHAYGTPDDFRAFIDACHGHGLSVILDLVFNHLGPEGNYSHQYSGLFFHRGKDNPWGQNFNLDGPNSEPVRAFLRQNVRYWLDEFRIDGLRMDATHAVHDSSDIHLLAEIAGLVHDRGGFIIAEDERNLRTILEPLENGGWNFDAVWADDFHHVIRVSQTHEQYSYYGMFHGLADEIAQTLRRGWFYCGQPSPFHKKSRGTPCDDFSPERFVHCISNHDQVGNRLLGDRLHHKISPAAYRALSLFLCLTPYTPLLFMGQEWGADTPFLYFTDMPDDLGGKIAEGRKREFSEMKIEVDSAAYERTPEPNDPKAFSLSKINWDELSQPRHRRLLDLYRAGLKIRFEFFGRRNPPRDCWTVEAGKSAVIIYYQIGGRRLAVSLNLETPEKDAWRDARVLLRSNAPEYAGNSADAGPETIVAAI